MNAVFSEKKYNKVYKTFTFYINKKEIHVYKNLADMKIIATISHVESDRETQANEFRVRLGPFDQHHSIPVFFARIYVFFSINNLRFILVVPELGV